MKFVVLSALVSTVFATSAVAQTTKTFDRPNYSGTRTITRADNASTRTVDIIRKSDGAAASASVTLTRTDGGVQATGTATNFAGKTRTIDRSFNGQGAGARPDRAGRLRAIRTRIGGRR